MAESTPVSLHAITTPVDDDSLVYHSPEIEWVSPRLKLSIDVVTLSEIVSVLLSLST